MSDKKESPRGDLLQRLGEARWDNQLFGEHRTAMLQAADAIRRMEDTITALRAEVGRLARHIVELDEERCERDAEVRALRGFAQYVFEAALAVDHATGAPYDTPLSPGLLLSFGREHGLYDSNDVATPLLTGEPGAGGER